MPKCPKDCHKPNPLIFRRVIIPAALGDDKENPPENGAYCNALVIYEANNAMYLYSSDGVPTKIPTSITSYNDLTNKPSINGVELEGDVNLEELGISDLIGESVASEATARADADEALQDAIDAEEAARIAADRDIVNSIPTVNDATLTIQKNGTSVGTFTANSASDTTINIDVPIYTSGLINDSGYVTEAALSGYATDQDIEDAVSAEADLRAAADQDLQTQIDAISSASDVVDVVGTYAELQNYDTSKLSNNDIIKVLTDSTHDNAISYYRWDDANDTFVYIGSQGPFYTKSETDATFVPQTRTVNGKALSTDISLTAADVNALPASTVIPTVNNATLTIKKNGNNVASFTANSASDVSADIAVPTKTSDITNDSGFITSAALPTKTSDLTNDGSDGTAAYLETDETAYKTASIPYGQCDSTSTATVFTATVPGVTELRDGVCMWLKNGVVTSASGFTININNLGAKPVYNNMAAATRDTTIWNVNYTMFFVYDSTRVEGGCWILYRGYNSDNNTIGYQIRTNSQSLPMTSVVYRYRLLFTSADNNHYVPANNSTSTNATASRTVCQDKINPFGCIFYYGTTASVAAGSRPGATALWEQYAIALGYSFNRTGAALTLTSWKPVYVKAAPQSDGSAIIDSTTPYVQDLPTTEDGKIYIFLGVAYSATNIELQLDHPVYWYKDGMIRPYTNAAAGISSVAWGGIAGTLSNQTDLNTALGTKANSADLATVATSGSYNDLSNKPTIPTVNNAVLTIQRNGANVDTFTANAAQDKTINIAVPTATSDLTNDSGFLTSIPTASSSVLGGIKVGSGLSIDNSGALSATGLQSVDWTDVTNRPTNVSYWTNDAGYITSAALPTKTSDLTNDGSDGSSTYVEADELSTVATSGSYNDLTNKPTIPTVNDAALTIQRNGVNIDSFTANASQNKSINVVVPTKTSDLTNDGASGTSTYVEADDLATVATSGSYNDLSNKPTIPTVNNATLTIQRNSTNVATFTANAASNVTANISVPTATSDLTNDSGFITSITKITNAEIDAIMGVA